MVATFQSLVRRIEQTKFDWLTRAACVVIDEAHGSVTPSYTTILNQLGLTPRETPISLVGLTATPFRGGAEDGGPETIRLRETLRRPPVRPRRVRRRRLLPAAAADGSAI